MVDAADDMGNCTKGDDSKTLVYFLERPLSRRAFDPFFELCYRHVRGYLGSLRARGHRLPTDPKDNRDPHADLSIDILGFFLRSTRDQPYILVFDYFRRHGITSFRRVDPDKLLAMFRSLLTGFVCQELSRIRKTENPQTEILKRRFKDILKGNAFAAFKSPDGSTEFLYSAKHKHVKGENCACVSYERLLEIVEEAFLQTNNRKAWCHAIFETIDQEESEPNCVRKHELLSAVVTVMSRHIEVEGLVPCSLPGADQGLLRRNVEKAGKLALHRLNEQVLAPFVGKGILTADIAERFAVAAERYISDMVHSPGVDLLPAYFREVMPEAEHARYLKRYKYTFETAIRKVEEDFRRRLRKLL